MIPHRAGNANFYLEQWDRVVRWKNQCKIESKAGAATSLDFYEAFFINAYHLKDWITQWLKKNKHDDIINELKLDFENQIFLKILRDICNGSKHFTL